jgi:hypothetical protein
MTGNGSVAIAGVVFTITNSGVSTTGGPGGGAAPAPFGNAISDRGIDGQANISTLGGFTIINDSPGKEGPNPSTRYGPAVIVTGASTAIAS